MYVCVCVYIYMHVYLCCAAMVAAAAGCSSAKASDSSSTATEYIPIRVARGAKMPKRKETFPSVSFHRCRCVSVRCADVASAA